MKKPIIILVILLIALGASAQIPEWQWATMAGGIGNDLGYAITTDENGNSYVTGYFSGTAAFGPYFLICSGSFDIFVAKLDVNGNWLWVTKAGGSSSDDGYAIAIDANGSSFVSGVFRDTAVFGSYSLTSSGWDDVFVAKLDINGNWLWATKAGGSGGDLGDGIAIDDNGNSYVTGSFQDTADFGSYSLTSSGNSDIFVAKLDATGNWLWATKAGGYNYDFARAIAIDNNGNSYVTGYFRDTTVFGSYSLNSSGWDDVFVAKLDINGIWLWATKAGGNSDDSGYAIDIDDIGNSYVTGIFMDTAYFGPYSKTSSGDTDVFVAKLNTNGNWQWVTKAGGYNYDFTRAITIDDNGNSYVTGYFKETTIFGSYYLTSSGYEDIFAAKLDAAGNWLWATKAGGSSNDLGYGIAIDNSGNSFVSGIFNDTSAFGLHSLTSSGWDDIFVAKLGNDTAAENEIIPAKMELLNYPNPFNPTTTIEFYIRNNSNIELSIYNIEGQKIKTLVQSELSKGSHSIIWNGDDESGGSVNSGIYLYRLYINGKTEAVKKCLLLK